MGGGILLVPGEHKAGTLCEVMSIKDLTWETREQAGHSEGQGEGPCLGVRKELAAGAEKGAWVRLEMFSETEHPPAKCLILGLWLPPSPELCGWEVGSGSGGLSPPTPQRVHTRCSSTSTVPALCLQSLCLHEAQGGTRPSDPCTNGHSPGGSPEGASCAVFLGLAKHCVKVKGRQGG